MFVKRNNGSGDVGRDGGGSEVSPADVSCALKFTCPCLDYCWFMMQRMLHQLSSSAVQIIYLFLILFIFVKYLSGRSFFVMLAKCADAISH